MVLGLLPLTGAASQDARQPLKSPPPQMDAKLHKVLSRRFREEETKTEGRLPPHLGCKPLLPSPVLATRGPVHLQYTS